MSSNTVALTGQEHLPPVLRLITDPTYRFSSHKHTVEESGDYINHTYTVVVSNQPLSGNTFDEIVAENEKKKIAKKEAAKKGVVSSPTSSSSLGHLVSQISSTTSSEKRSAVAKNRSPIVSMHAVKPGVVVPKHEPQYMTLGSLASSMETITSDSSGTVSLPMAKGTSSSSTSSSCQSEETLPTTRSLPRARVRPSSPKESLAVPPSVITDPPSDLSSKKSLPKYTYSSSNLKGNRSAKYVMMVHVKFILVHRDFFNRKVQSSFIEEFASDIHLEDVIFSFRQLCIRILADSDFKPRFSFCVGDLNQSNSKAVQPCDMKKTLAQMAGSHAITKFALIADNVH